MDYKLRTNIATRLMDYISSGKHPLRQMQVKVFEDIVAHVDAGHDYGYVKRPTGTGKTVNYVAEIAALDMPALIITPRTNLTTQIHDTFLNKELFDFDPEQIGVYHAQRTYEEKAVALKAPILITTFASYIMLSKRGDISSKDRPLVFLDEVHHARGDVVRPLVQELFGDVYVQGWTATDTFITGQHIGYYLFNGLPPIHVTSVSQAVASGEIAPYKNIIVETHLGSGVKVRSWTDYTQKKLERIVKEAGRDEAAIRLFLETYDEETGLVLRDMKSIWYCAGIDHAERVAEKLTNIFGENYALAVSGQTPKDDLERILDAHRAGEIPHLVNADLLIEGYDSPSSSLAMILRPTRSPIVAEQTGGRILRIDPNNPNKIGYIVTLIDEGMYDIVPFGVVAGNMVLIQERKYYTTIPKRTDTKRADTERKLDFYDYPELSGIEVHTSQIALEEFVARRNEFLGLPKSSRFTPQQITEIINAYWPHKGNSSEAARYSPYNYVTFLRYWRKVGLKPKPIPRLTPQQIDEIISAHPKYDGNAFEAARNLPYTQVTFLKHWKRNGFEIRTQGHHRRRLSQNQINEIVTVYQTCRNISEVRRQLHHTTNTIRKYLRGAGLIA